MTRPRPAWTPPLRDGVSASRVAVSGGPWDSVAAFLTARLRPGIDWAQRIAQGEVIDQQGQPVTAHTPCKDGAVYWYWRSLPPEPRVPFELDVLHQCEHLVVVDKPHFLAVTPGGRHLQETALVRLKRQLGIDTLVPMHRLDLETAGVLAFTVQPAARHAYHALMREHRAHKVYEAVAPWRGDLALPFTASHRLQEPAGEGFMQMQVLAGEPNAHTRIELMRRLDAHTAGPETSADCDHGDQPAPLALYRLTPLTGRKHQLRAQMNALGLPIVGDRIYPRLWPEPASDAAPDFSNPLQLLARELAFTDPVIGQPRRFISRRQLALAACADTAQPSSPLHPDPSSP